MNFKAIFAQNCDFMLGVAALHQLPDASKPEFPFAGRSNVGKSSLLNALTHRKALAKTSHTPGRTQQLNFFNLADTLYLVDMPGYGYAKVSKADRAAWQTLIKDYLRGRQSLRCCFVLIDSRHGIKDSDLDIMALLNDAAVSFRVILTKIDKVKDEHLDKIRTDVRAALKDHPAAYPEPLETSAHKKTGIEDIQAVMASYI